MNLDTRTKKSVADSIVSDLPRGSCNVPVRYVIAEPGNGTRYSLVFTDLKGSDEVGEQGGWLVTWINSLDLKAMVVTDNGGFLDWRYVMKKMRASIADAVCLAEIIGHCTGREYETCEEVAQIEEE